MADKKTLYFLDFGLSNMKDGVLQGRILSCDSDGAGLKPVLEGLKTMPDGIDIFGDQIFYTAMGNPKENNGAIYCVDLDGKNNHAIVPHGKTHTPKQLKVDPKHRKVYWSDREGMGLFRCNLDGTGLELLYKSGSSEDDRKDARNWCVGICVDSSRNKIYWTQKGSSKGNEGRLFAATLTAAADQDETALINIQVLLSGLPEPIDLDLDVDNNILYLTDRGDPPLGNSISRIQLSADGDQVIEKRILVRKLHEAIGLAIDPKNGRMFFTDLNGSVYRANIDGTDEKVLFLDIGDCAGIACAPV